MVKKGHLNGQKEHLNGQKKAFKWSEKAFKWSEKEHRVLPRFLTREGAIFKENDWPVM